MTMELLYLTQSQIRDQTLQYELSMRDVEVISIGEQKIGSTYEERLFK